LDLHSNLRSGTPPGGWNSTESPSPEQQHPRRLYFHTPARRKRLVGVCVLLTLCTWSGHVKVSTIDLITNLLLRRYRTTIVSRSQCSLSRYA
jgi:hypothetical protein